MRPLTPEIVRELLDYDAETGVLTWRRRALRSGYERMDTGWNVRFEGKPAGRIGKHGAFYTNVAYPMHNPKNYANHRLAWAHYYGEWPETLLDHANGDPSDNRIANLRLASPGQNLQNARLRADNTSGHKGVYWRKKEKKWCAQICYNGKVRVIGVYETIEEAVAARRKEAAALFGEFARET